MIELPEVIADRARMCKAERPRHEAVCFELQQRYQLFRGCCVGMRVTQQFAPSDECRLGDSSGFIYTSHVAQDQGKFMASAQTLWMKVRKYPRPVNEYAGELLDRLARVAGAVKFKGTMMSRVKSVWVVRPKYSSSVSDDLVKTLD